MRAVQLNSAFSSLIAAMMLMASLLMAPGCGESNYSSADSDLDTDLSKTGQYEGYVLEHWDTDPDTLYDGLEVTYSPLVEGSGGEQKRIGDRNSIDVSLSLVENNEDIRAYGSILLDAQTSLTSHSMEILFERSQVVAGYEGITVTASGTLTTKTESGTLIQPEYELTLEITKMSDGRTRCYSRIEIEDLFRIAEFKIPITRTGKDDPISFFYSTWEKKDRVFNINYPRKRYGSQTPVTGLADRDILKLKISETEAKVLEGSEFYLPAALSPNKLTDITIDLTDVEVLSNLDHIVDIEKRGTLDHDIVDMNGNPLLNKNYQLSLQVSKKIVLEPQDQVGCETACKDKCAIDYSGEELTTCQERCENRSCVERVEQYSMRASLELEGLKIRTSMVQVVKREDDLNDNDGDGFHDDFYGAEFLLPVGQTYSVAHAVSEEDRYTDDFDISYDKVLLNLTVSKDNKAYGELHLPAQVSPDGLPDMTLYLGTSEANLDVSGLTGNYSGFQIGSDTRTEAEPDNTSGWLATKISRHYRTNDGEVAIDEDGLIYLSVAELSNGAQECQIYFKTNDNWLKIEVEGMEVTHDVGDNMATFSVVQSPRQIVDINPVADCDPQNLTQEMYESDVDVKVTLAKHWDGVVKSIRVIEGKVEIRHVLECLNTSISEVVPSDTVVYEENITEDGFTIVTDLVKQEGEEALTTIALNKLYGDEGEEYEFQIELMPTVGDVVSFNLPAQRTDWTGVFISTAEN